MSNKPDYEKRTRDMLKLALDHFNDSQALELSGDYESVQFELAMAEEYREIFWRRMNSGERQYEFETD